MTAPQIVEFSLGAPIAPSVIALAFPPDIRHVPVPGGSLPTDEAKGDSDER